MTDTPRNTLRDGSRISVSAVPKTENLWHAIRDSFGKPSCSPFGTGGLSPSGAFSGHVVQCVVDHLQCGLNIAESVNGETRIDIQEFAAKTGEVLGSFLSALEKANGAQLSDEVLQRCADGVRAKAGKLAKSKLDIARSFNDGMSDGLDAPMPDFAKLLDDARANLDPNELFAVKCGRDAIRWPKVSSKGISPTHANIRAFLAHHKLRLWFDEFRVEGRIEGSELVELVRDGQLDDAVLGILWTMIHAAGCEVSKAFFADTLEAMAYQDKRHPVREKFKSVKWDGKPRLDGLFTKYAGADNTPLIRAYGRAFMLTIVRRVFEPGCEMYGFPILEGLSTTGGEGKSKLAKALVGAQYHTDCLDLGATPKEVLEVTGGKLLVEFSELTGLNSQRGFDRVKAMLSRTEDKARKAFGRFTSGVPRQFSFVGSTNESQYLPERGGLRRFWPLKVTGKRINTAGIERDRDQLWAEAYAAYQAGEDHNIPKELWDDANEDRAERVLTMAGEDVLSPVLQNAPDGFITNAELRNVFERAERLPEYKDMTDKRTLVVLAKRFGFERWSRSQPGNHKTTERGYLKGSDWHTTLVQDPRSGALKVAREKPSTVNVGDSTKVVAMPARRVKPATSKSVSVNEASH